MRGGWVGGLHGGTASAGQRNCRRAPPCWPAQHPHLTGGDSDAPNKEVPGDGRISPFRRSRTSAPAQCAA